MCAVPCTVAGAVAGTPWGATPTGQIRLFSAPGRRGEPAAGGGRPPGRPRDKKQI